MGYREQAARHRDPRFARAFAIIDRQRKPRAAVVSVQQNICVQGQVSERTARQIELACRRQSAVSPPLEPDNDIRTLRALYREVIGKKPFWGWDAMQLKAKIDAARAA